MTIPLFDISSPATPGPSDSVVRAVLELVAAGKYAQLTKPDPRWGYDLVWLAEDDHGVHSAFYGLGDGHAPMLHQLLRAGRIRAGKRITAPLATDRRPARVLELSAAERTAFLAAHPLSARLGIHIGLHPDAGPIGGDFHTGLRCESCRHRRIAPPEISGRAYAKCAVNEWERATQGAGSDVLSYWPACVDYKPESAAPPGEVPT